MRQSRIAALEQARSQCAFRRVESWKRDEVLTECLKYLKGLPIALRTQGMILTCAGLLKKNERATLLIVDALASWLAEKQCPCAVGIPLSQVSGRQLLRYSIEEQDHQHYRAVQRETIVFAEKLKLVAEVWDNGQ